MKNKIFMIGLVILGIVSGCTDLTEHPYNIITQDQYYQTADDIRRAYVRPFEHCYWTVQGDYFNLQENSADHTATYNRQGHWLDGQNYFRIHYHTWTIDDGMIHGGWNNLFNGVAFANSVIDDFAKLDPAAFGMPQTEFDEMKEGARVLRAWLYVRLFDLYRNLPIAKSTRDMSQNSEGQVSPKEIFEFIETELKETITKLPKKTALGGNLNLQGQFTKAAAAALLVKLYLNAEKWTGEAKYTECATVAQDIIDGKYGVYALSKRWDEPYDWDNEKCDEIIFGYSGTFGRNHWQYDGGLYWWNAPFKASPYFGFTDWGDMNQRYGLQPGLNVDGNEYPFTLGKIVLKFKKYPEDYRLVKYKNLGGSKREGMMLFGYLDYKLADGTPARVMADNGRYTIYLRDQVGWFEDADPSTVIADKVSTMDHADQNSGWHCIKYPIYMDSDAGKMEADYADIRLAEIYYSLAECKFRAGDVTGAGTLINAVRKRNYPQAKHAEYLYQPEGNTVLTADELLDEWGREFLMEGRRRTDLCRWNKFTTGEWWDKKPDADSHTDIYPLSRRILNADLKLKQNPGYDDIAR